MCGIGGIVRIGNRKIRKWQLQHMALELQHRGTDATGFALMDADGTIHIWKVADPAWKAVASKAFNEWCEKALSDNTRILLVHTRAYTKGSPHNNENNHPLYTTPEKGRAVEGVVVHNGMVRNDDSLFEVNKKLKGFVRSCATDSDVFRALLDNHGCIDKALIKQMGLVEGTAAVAAIHRNSPGKLLLLRDSNPLVLGATQDTLGFASTKEALHKTLKPWIEVHNIPMQVHAPDLSFVAMPNETGYIIDIYADTPGLVAHDVFKCNGRGTGGYVRYGKSTSYWDKQKRAQVEAQAENARKATANGSRILVSEEKAKVAASASAASVNPTQHHSTAINDPRLFEYTICPNEKCNKHVKLSDDDRRLVSIAMLACKSCGTNLTGGQDASLQVN